MEFSPRSKCLSSSKSHTLFPLGADGGLDFGVIRVGDETKQTCTLKNKGKYEISFHFFFEEDESSPIQFNELFTINPSRGTLIQSDRPTQVQVSFKSKKEVTVKDQPVLKCQVSISSSACSC